ncbi:pyruvate formate-lyase activating enzyme [Sphaerospermopsis reniformis]|uniref:Pyruvate formate-lyase-activating enzyme n=1 Tax=Sphaerospermopsis reniformis TaxID=531300 RepID=A0A479ZUV0_9CYAN|nr:pyruvate formate-lyase-activating protein [Sphaerospermopsis reniformis]GCL35283.1 pyruvate formate-lyase activating enzyme [Sphaerospermopsis reniformis]
MNTSIYESPNRFVQTVSQSSHISGHIHSVETCGTVDGPGIRFVIFTQGCLLRCLYCHNPDTRDTAGGITVTPEELIAEIEKYRSYMQFSGGGVTISGGEPLLQPEFVREIFRRCKELQIHTALDTSGFPDLTASKPVLEFVDLVLLDIKSFDPKTYLHLTGVSVEPTLRFAEYLRDINKPTWIRFVLVPNLTDDLENVTKLAEFISKLTNIEKLEVLPFHKLGEYKWHQLKYHYELENTQPPTPEQIQKVQEIFIVHGIQVQ